MNNKFKTIIIISILVIIILMYFCACDNDFQSTFSPPSDPVKNQTEEYGIALPVRDSDSIKIGKFILAGAVSYRLYCIYEVLPNDFDNFEKLIQSCQYYKGKINIKNLSAIPKMNENVFKENDECDWLSHEGYVWIGKKYANKFYYIAQTNIITIEGGKFFIYLSKFIFSNNQTPNESGVEYKTDLSWEQLKSIYNVYPINDNERTIDIDCYIYYNQVSGSDYTTKAYVKLIYNEEKSTIEISKDFTLK